MKRDLYFVIGCPGSGKSWVCEQLKESFDYVPHDQFLAENGKFHREALLQELGSDSQKPVLTEFPFSFSEMKSFFESIPGINVIPVFIQEETPVLQERYLAREKKPIPKGHLTRQNTFSERAKLWDSFSGTSEQVLNHLKDRMKTQ